MSNVITDIRRPPNTKEVLPLPLPLRYFEAEPWRGEGQPLYAIRDDDERLHCDDEVAVRFEDFGSEYWRHGRVHRDGDKPALYIEYSNSVQLALGSAVREDECSLVKLVPGSEVYCVDGVIHREGGAAIVNHGGADTYLMEYWHRGRRHCSYAPAVTTAYVQLWYYHGLLHREDGPACIRSDPAESTCYWYGRALSFDAGLSEDFPFDEPPALLVLHALASSEWCPGLEDFGISQLVSRACALMPELSLMKADMEMPEWEMFRKAIDAYLRGPSTCSSTPSDSLTLPDGLIEES
jgi:hypothetical protein